MPMMKPLNIVIFLLLTLPYPEATAQRRQLSTESSRAERAYYKGTDCLSIRDYNCAEKELQRAVSADEGFSEAWIVLGEVLADLERYEEALDAFRKAISVGRTFYPDALYYAGTLELRTGQYEEARKHLSDFLESSSTPSRRRMVAELKLRSCEFAVNALRNPMPFEPLNLGPAINSVYSEYFPCLTVDNQTLLFTRRIPDPQMDEREQEDFFVSVRENGEWISARSIGMPINTLFNEGAPALSPDGSFLIFTACSSQAGYGEGREGYGSCDLFISYRQGSQWSRPENLGSPVNSSRWETQPAIAPDGKTLYFIRGFHDASQQYQQDIYTTVYHPETGWSIPEKLPDHVNSPGLEESVFIHPDGVTLYFSSDGWPGMGGLDIFVTRKNPDGTWSQPENLGYPINTHHDENSLMVSGDGKRGYFASDRPGGYGNLDLYSFQIPEQFRPSPITYLKGRVYDEKSLEPLSASFYLIDLNSGEIVVKSTSDPSDGSFLVALPFGRSYALNATHPGYLFFSEHFDLDQGDYSYDNPFLKDVPLKSIRIGETVVLRNVFFDTDSYALLKESRVELDRLAGMLRENPSIRIEISGHTDNQGNDEYNLELSWNRAKTVYQYLVDAGIAMDRLAFKGFGETRPVAGNDDEAGRALNRRTEFKITQL